MGVALKKIRYIDLCPLVARISLALHEAKSEYGFFPQDLRVCLCSFPPSPVGHHQPPARIQAGRCVRGHSKGGFARLTPNTPACHRVGTYGKHCWQYQSWSINTFIVSAHAVCSLKYTDFARGVFYWWWENPN